MEISTMKILADSTVSISSRRVSLRDVMGSAVTDGLPHLERDCKAAEDAMHFCECLSSLLELKEEARAYHPEQFADEDAATAKYLAEAGEFIPDLSTHAVLLLSETEAALAELLRIERERVIAELAA
jgi:hypothetical protein